MSALNMPQAQFVGTLDWRNYSNVAEGYNVDAPYRALGPTDFFAKLPSSSRWLRSSIVERQTVSTDISWQSRLMVLTSEDVYFAKPDSDLVVDRLPLRCISFISKVDHAKDALGDQGITLPGRLGFSPSDRSFKRQSRRRSSVMFSATLKMDNMGDLQDGTRETFAFEIRVTSDAADDDAAAPDERSYFARVDSAEECDVWIAEIKAAMKKVRSMRSKRSPAAARMQARAKKVADSTAWRCLVALAIFSNFVCSVVEARRPALEITPVSAAPRSKSRPSRPRPAQVCVVAQALALGWRGCVAGGEWETSRMERRGRARERRRTARERTERKGGGEGR